LSSFDIEIAVEFEQQNTIVVISDIEWKKGPFILMKLDFYPTPI